MIEVIRGHMTYECEEPGCHGDVKESFESDTSITTTTPCSVCGNEKLGADKALTLAKKICRHRTKQESANVMRKAWLELAQDGLLR